MAVVQHLVRSGAQIKMDGPDDKNPLICDALESKNRICRVLADKDLEPEAMQDRTAMWKTACRGQFGTNSKTTH